MVADLVAVLQVSQIKEKVEEKEGIPPVQQRLIHGGKQMYEVHNTTDHDPKAFFPLLYSS